MSTSSVPRVGVGVIIMREGQVLVGKRKGSHGAGTYALPGGHLEFGESFEQCAEREVMEETGLKLTDVHFAWACNSIFDEKTQYVTIFMRATLLEDKQQATNTEPEKCEGWMWVPYNEVPEPRFAPLEHLLKSDYKPAEDVGSLNVLLGAPIGMAEAR